MNIFDAHCDVLYKLFLDSRLPFKDSKSLQVNLDGLNAAGVKVQCFAIYIPESVHPDMRFHAALYMIELFFERVIKTNPQLKMITDYKDIKQLGADDIGAILTLEGCDAIGQDLLKLKTLLRLGVTSVGLTWNHSNAVADGVLEERGAGLSTFGKKVVHLLNESAIWCDVSHLSERGFWDVIELSDYPIASHSNCYSLCPHPRNLSNDQIKSLIERNGVIGITFYPEYLTARKIATVTDILRHLEYVCSLGGENHVGFGSDFDGMGDKLPMGIASVEDYDLLINELIKYYSSKQIENFLFKNFIERYPQKS
ncbi:membrane dipeptidase [Cytobacillus eiseniae]|uniref:Membrane dipeptidase n=1 Tax=Cytobacillus eiseniae TaxID=762947 RepID=A0ABS4RCR5_9BACI|nr:dipeptidase [Cytobacillus eiseniae]MBP2240206.1 membrane dipeptidase [Cytobacillus eiseniae]